MEAAVLLPVVLGLLLLPLLAVLLTALCVRCRELPDTYAYDSAVPDSLPRSIMIKRPPTLAPWPQATVTSCPPLSQPDLLPIPRSPQPPGGSHRMPSARQDSDGTNSVASYENEEAACEDEDDEEDYHNEGYFGVGEDYVNVPESEESADASLDGSREYVNVSQELQPTVRTESATLASQEAEEEEEEGAPDYENLQELQ